MRISSIVARWSEGLGLGATAAIAGLLNKGDPSFAGASFLPQVLAPILAASLLGLGPGLLSLAAAAAATAALPALAGLLGLGLGFPPTRALAEAARLPAAAALVSVLAAGNMRDAYERSSRRLLGRLRVLVRREAQLKKMNKALVTLSDELERRVSGQRDSVSALHARMRKLDSSDLGTVLAGLVDAVVAFSQASSVAVYEYEAKSRRLVAAAHLGPEPQPELGLEESLEGWVFRSGSVFSLRSADDYLGLPREEEGKSVLAYPLKAGELPWGVLNVREMPFYRYNPITENNLGVIVELSASYIKKAVDFRDRVLRRPRNEITGLPGYAELLGVLGEELAKRESRGLAVSLVVVELLGFAELAFARSGVEAFGILKAFAEAALEKGRALAFHFKEDGQLAFVLPDSGREGASLFCLGLSELALSDSWRKPGDADCLEIAFGLSSCPGSPIVDAARLEDRPAALIAEAEAVLSLQKGAFDEHGGRCP